MPDPSLSDALAEAAALAPADEIIRHTLEIRHLDFVDDAGEPDSMWLIADTEDLTAPIEAGAAVKGGQWVTFKAVPFSFALMPIEAGTTPEIEITIDNVNRALIRYLDLAMESGKPIVVAYRPYLDSAIADGPQMDPVPTFEITEITVGSTSAVMKARTGVDLRGVFPIRQYALADFPGLSGR
jgi:Domain of unknown function (DUF1833)